MVKGTIQKLRVFKSFNGFIQHETLVVQTDKGIRIYQDKLPQLKIGDQIDV